jgi:hypothetical protein
VRWGARAHGKTTCENMTSPPSPAPQRDSGGDFVLQARLDPHARRAPKLRYINVVYNTRRKTTTGCRAWLVSSVQLREPLRGAMRYLRRSSRPSAPRSYPKCRIRVAAHAEDVQARLREVERPVGHLRGGPQEGGRRSAVDQLTARHSCHLRLAARTAATAPSENPSDVVPPSLATYGGGPTPPGPPYVASQ